MIHSTNRTKIGIALFSLCIGLYGHISGETVQKSTPQTPIEVKYRLIDLGESDVDPERLSRNSKLPSLAPAINNAGQIIGNRKEGGFVRDPIAGEWAPFIHPDVQINFHALTNRGDLLVTINRQSNPQEWMVWPTTTGKNGPRERINVDSYPSTDVVFTGLTNNRMAIGNLLRDNKSQPIYWTANSQVRFVVDDAGKTVEGKNKSVNNNDQIAGFFQKLKDLPPGVWSRDKGLQYIRNYRSNPIPQGEAELADLLIADDGTVYGTYKINHADSVKQTGYYTYAWLPYEGGGFKLLDIEGMRLNALNDWHVLVGNCRGQAAICEPGHKPIELSRLIKAEDGNNWELIEATSINNWGDIVGYGKFKGDMHVFLLEKINSHAPYAR